MRSLLLTVLSLWIAQSALASVTSGKIINHTDKKNGEIQIKIYWLCDAGFGAGRKGVASFDVKEDGSYVIDDKKIPHCSSWNNLKQDFTFESKKGDWKTSKNFYDPRQVLFHLTRIRPQEYQMKTHIPETGYIVTLDAYQIHKFVTGEGYNDRDAVSWNSHFKAHGNSFTVPEVFMAIYVKDAAEVINFEARMNVATDEFPPQSIAKSITISNPTDLNNIDLVFDF